AVLFDNRIDVRVANRQTVGRVGFFLGAGRLDLDPDLVFAGDGTVAVLVVFQCIVSFRVRQPPARPAMFGPEIHHELFDTVAAAGDRAADLHDLWALGAAASHEDQQNKWQKQTRASR